MPSTTSDTLVTQALTTLGVTAAGTAPTAAELTDGFTRLNAMLSGWALQSLTINAIAREVFGITADVGIYTIGPGGDFDTSRPTSLNGAAVLLNSGSTALSVTTLTSSGTVATATTSAAHGLSDGQNVTIAGVTPTAAFANYNGTFPVTVTGATTFTYVFAGGTSPATGTKTALPEQTDTAVVEIPRSVITDDAWQAIQLKSLTNVFESYVYYNPTYVGGFGTVTLWPIPTTADNSLVLYRPQQLTAFPSQTATYQIPEAAEEALIYNLARRLLTPNGISDESTVSDIVDMARTTLATFKRGNVKLTDLANDPALTRNPRTGYNILSGA